MTAFSFVLIRIVHAGTFSKTSLRIAIVDPFLRAAVAMILASARDGEKARGLRYSRRASDVNVAPLLASVAALSPACPGRRTIIARLGTKAVLQCTAAAVATEPVSKSPHTKNIQ